ncbi:MAG: hypothetical protein IPM80_19430 [Proteobacteria bacterium]|nr:hypothetical protein [Pseudomonadota bacterium]
MKPPRKRVQAMAQGRGRGERVVVPLAFEVAARISARPLDEFRNDATQLANGLGELQQAVAADGVVCALASRMEWDSAAGAGLDVERITAQGAVGASLEACRRLREVHGDQLVLLAGLSGPATLAAQFEVDLTAACAAFAALTKAFCAAGADVILLMEDAGCECGGEDWQDGVKTAANIARFHQALLLAWDGVGGVAAPVQVALSAPAASGVGIVTTEAVVPAEADIAMLRHWVTTVRGAEA